MTSLYYSTTRAKFDSMHFLYLLYIVLNRRIEMKENTQKS